MFTCQVCGHTAPPNTTCHKVINSQKLVYHPSRARANRLKTEEGRWEDVPDFGGKGLQTTREINVCVACFPNYNPEVKVTEVAPKQFQRDERDDDDRPRNGRDRDRDRDRNRDENRRY